MSIQHTRSCDDCGATFTTAEETGEGESNRTACTECRPPIGRQPCERCGALTTVSRPFGAMCVGCAFADSH